MALLAALQLRKMFASVGAGHVTLYRQVGRQLVFWRVVKGTPQQIEQAISIARELDLMAAGVGGWARALLLGLDPAKPKKTSGVSSGVFLQDYLNRCLRDS